MKRIHENEEKLRVALDEQERVILDTIKDDCITVSGSIGKRRFHGVFRLGVYVFRQVIRLYFA